MPTHDDCTFTNASGNCLHEAQAPAPNRASPAWTRADQTLQGPGWAFHRWEGTDPHCQRCGLLYEVFTLVDGPARCPDATVVEELTALYGKPDLDKQVTYHSTGVVARSIHWSRTPQRGRVYFMVQWSGTGGEWEVVAGHDPTSSAEGRQVEFSYGTDEAHRPPQELLRIACVLAGVLDA